MKTTSLNLLHQSPETLLTTSDTQIKTLHLLTSIIKLAINALDLFFLKKDFSFFDPHVGETLCQIRAYRILLLDLKNRDALFAIKKEITELKQLYLLGKKQLITLHDISNTKNSKLQQEVFKKKSILSLLHENELYFEISQEAFFLTQAYFLTIFKTTTADGDIYIDHDKITDEISITRKFSKKIVHYYQSNLAKDSTDFIFELLNELPEHNDIAVVSNALKNRDDDERIVLPCYTSTKVLLSHAARNENLILLAIKRQDENGYDDDPAFLLFKSNKSLNDYQLIDLQTITSKTPCVVIHGLSVSNEFDRKGLLEKRIINFGLSNIIFSNMAYHPQFSGKKLKNLSYNPFRNLAADVEQGLYDKYSLNKIFSSLEKEFLFMKTLAEKAGCCDSNKSLFFIEHIFCDTIASQLKSFATIHKNKNVRYEKMPYDDLLAA